MKFLSRIRDFVYIFIDYLLILLVFGALVFFAFHSYNNLLAIDVTTSEPAGTVEESSSAPASTITVSIPESVTREQLATILVSYGILAESDSTAFVDYLAQQGIEEPLPSGDFEMTENMEFADIVQVLQAK